MRLLLSYCVFLCCTHLSFAKKPPVVNYAKEEAAIILAHTKISRNASQEDNLRNNAALIALFDSLLSKHPDTFFYPFANLPFGNVIAPDNAFRIFSWFMLHENGEYENFAFLQTNPQSSMAYQVVQLLDMRGNIRTPGAAMCRPDFWYGACYYSIIGVKRDGETLYTLLGWNPNNMLTQQKVIEVIRFRRNAIEFGFPLIEVRGRGAQRRVIFEYSARNSMVLRFEPRMKMIVFDHLAPSNPHFEGLFEHYGPDGSYDGYKYRQGRWRFENDIDVRNPRSEFKHYLPGFIRNIFYPDRTIDR